MTMDKRKVNIVYQIINKSYQNTSLYKLANDFSVSERTIRNDIVKINQYFSYISDKFLKLDSSGMVYLDEDINIKDVKEALKGMNFYDYTLSKEERVFVNICILILSNRYVTYQEIAKFMYVSRFTVIDDFSSVNDFLKDFNLEVFSLSNKGLKIHGLERNIRKAILNIIINDTELVARFLKQETLNKFIDLKRTKIEGNLEIIYKIIKEVEYENKTYFTDISLERLSYYLYFMIIRISYGEIVEMKKKTDNCQKNGKMATDLLKRIGQYFDLEIEEDEFGLLQEMLGRLNYIRREVNNPDIIKIQMVTRKFIELVSSSLNINLNNDYNLFMNLSSHLERLFSSSGIKYPEYFGIDKIVEKNKVVLKAVEENIKILEEYAKKEISYTDIKFIVVYICVAIEKKKKSVKDLSVIIVCNNGISTSQLLKEQLLKYFDFIIIEVLSLHQLENVSLQHADLIISTIPLNGYGFEYIHVSPILDIEDIVNIDKKLDDIKMDSIRGFKKINKNYILPQSIKNNFINAIGLSELLGVENIEIDVLAKDWRDSIRKAARILEKNGDINQRYTESMINNVEKNGPYIVISKGFALPHSKYDQGVNHLGMGLIRLSKPVEYGIKELDPIEFVCVMSTIDNKAHLKALFTLVNILKLDGFHRDIRKAKTSEGLFNVIAYYEQEFNRNLKSGGVYNES